MAASDDVVIGQTFRFQWTVSNGNAALPPFTIHAVWSAGPEGPLMAYKSAVVSSWVRSSMCTTSPGPSPGAVTGAGEITLTCPADADLPGFTLWFTTHSPGHFALTATLSSSDVVDPEASNNSYSWETNVNCSITGTSGDDELVGTEGADSICGGEGNDHLVAFGSEGEDWLFGQDGDDLFTGADATASGYAVGGPGFDTVSYQNAEHGVIVCEGGPWGSRYAANIKPWAPNALIDDERFIGSNYGDLFVGSSGDEYFVGRAGPDRFVGRGGNDQLFGNTGNDRFISRDRRRDLVKGGMGRDLVQADSGDTVFSATKVATKPLVDICAG